MNKNSFFKRLGAQLLPQYFALLLLCCVSVGYAQTKTITGTITDDLGVLIGATVQVKGSTTATLTDFAGNFTIKAAPTDVLIFSYLGYKTLEKAVGNQLEIAVQLTQDTTMLKEVVVNAGYYSVGRTKERTG